MSWSEPLSGLDAAFLHAEDATAHMHVGAVALFEGTAPSQEELAAHVAARLPSLPRYRQRLAFAALALGRPRWVDAAEVDLATHVHHATLQAPGGEAELDALAGRVFGEQLDRRRPLWELWLADGLQRGGFALVLKTHHCVVDGVSGFELASSLLGGDPPSRDPLAVPRPPGVPGPAPGPGDDAAGEAPRVPGLPRRALGAAQARGAQAAAALALLAGGALPLVRLGLLGRAPPSSLNRPIGPHRQWRTASLDLDRVKAVRRALGGTVNDVVLAAVAGALRTLLAARGEAPASLRAMVPVSVRTPGARAAPGNRVAALFCDLPVGEADPRVRHARLVERTQRLKASGQALGTLLWTRLADVAFSPVLAAVARYQAGHRYMNLVVTNIPGPAAPLSLLGRRMTGWYPLVPLAQQQTLGVAVESYCGRLGFGLVADAAQVPDLPLFARAVPEAFEELASLAARAALPGR